LRVLHLWSIEQVNKAFQRLSCTWPPKTRTRAEAMKLRAREAVSCLKIFSSF
jgi:hypothetical protein